MSELKQRLRDGKGEDRELNDEIALRFGWVPKQAFDGEWYWTDPSGKGCGETPPAFTSDLNAVFALVERELPEWKYWELRSQAGKKRYVANLECWPEGEPSSSIKYATGNAESPCRALLLALLAAKELRP